MRFVYRYSKLPDQLQNLSDIEASAARLYNKLLRIDLDSIKLSDYTKRYFKTKMKSLTSALQFASYSLSWSIAGSDKPYKDFHFIECGAGSGLVSLLAKELGLIVIYNDIYDISVNDAKMIADTVGNRADYYVQGDINSILKFLKLKSIDCDAIASTDVIEHIYNIGEFFCKMPLLSGGPMSVVMSSGANQYHPYIKRKLMKTQIEVESKDRRKEYGHKERDTLKAYRSIRQELISEYITNLKVNLSKDELDTLVENTRGMIKEDIFFTIDKYMLTRQMPPLPRHPTNTCDPYTGNWAEHLMNPYDLASTLAKKGFDALVIEGYYGNLSNTILRYVGKFLDLLIYSNALGSRSLMLSPFFTIYGRRNLSASNELR